MLAVQLEPATAVPSVRYAWDADTEILSAALAPVGVREPSGVSGSIEVQGDDGSWLSFELAEKRLLRHAASWTLRAPTATRAAPAHAPTRRPLPRTNAPSDRRAGLPCAGPAC